MSLSSQVRVGVRVRPLSHTEGKEILEVSEDDKSIEVTGKRFSYDYVFHPHVSQEQLYESVKPLLNSFLDGYNATIMAYGQTGSGKTFTMGSGLHGDFTEATGLIPHFMRDIFANLPDTIELTASFLEVYGEDIHDLLDPSRPSLPIREDSNGGIVCAGLTCKTISNCEEALRVLYEGTANRTTAATLMNLTSSRSHAIFTVNLENNNVKSRFTFVDLAGSERLKKTGASGERAREGIEINKGLLALGNVINALSDEERLQKKLHVPYRQSKLTRLLQEALGGNSQTLFLACVSPADTNASETLSTLHYANRARNIQNAVTKNVDENARQVGLLRAYVSVLQNELVQAKLPDAPQEDVDAYLAGLHSIAQRKVGSVSNLKLPAFTTTATETLPPTSAERLPLQDANNHSTILENFDPALLQEVNPDEEMAILDQLIELQQQDQEYDQEQKKDNEQLKAVEGELAEQENLLLQLRESLKVYHNMKTKYEHLVAEVQQLEVEKAQLAQQLEKAQNDPTHGCKRSIQKELEKVERNLVRARSETRKYKDLLRKYEQQAQKLKVMETKISDLKKSRATLIKKQKETAAKHRAWTERTTRQLAKLQRKDRDNTQRVTKLQQQIEIHKRNLDKRQEFCQKLLHQKKTAEEHLWKLLKSRERKWKPSTKTNKHTELDKFVETTIRAAIAKADYETRVEDYSQAMQKLMNAVQTKDDELPDLQVQVDVCESALEKSRMNLIEAPEVKVSDDTRRIIDKLVSLAVLHHQASKLLERKDGIVQSLEMQLQESGAKSALLEAKLCNVNTAVDQQQVETLEKKVGLAVRDKQEMELQLAATREELTVFKVAVEQSDGIQAPTDVLDQLQTLWNDLGTSAADREASRQQIQDCLPITCQRIVDETKNLRSETESAIHKLEAEISTMCAALGLKPEEAKGTLLVRLDNLQAQKNRITPTYVSATVRRNRIVEQVNHLVVLLGKESLDPSLLGLVKDVNDLSDDYLGQCEAAVASMQVQKSTILASNAKLQQEAHNVAAEMNANEVEVMVIVPHSIKRREKAMPSWWNPEMAETVARAVTAAGGVVLSSKLFAQHMVAFRDALTNVSQARRLLSTQLRDLVERAQRTLLKTVDGEFEANEAYSNFHEALFRLPALSKERIHACLAEVEALMTSVDDMSQSEIEGLTVVWEALNISMAERGKFWGSIDESLRELQSRTDGPFDEVIKLSRSDGEEWVLNAVKAGTKNYRELETRLFKLEKIHEEVERLRTRQDEKSRIISLDSEVRILSSKLNEFEDKKCVKQRLTTKKNTSSTLLKEERFRKQMQTKFTTKLDQLVEHLKAWKTNEGTLFDPNLLSEDVRAHLKNTDRNEFMHLRTVEYKKRDTSDVKKRGLEVAAPPPPKRVRTNSKSLTTRPPVPRSSTKRQKSDNDDDAENTKRTPLVQASNAKKRLTLDPFASVLDQAFSPKNKENPNA